MRMQSSQANCGPLALKNALSALGYERSEEVIEVLAETSAQNGTSPAKLMKAALTLASECLLAPYRLKQGTRQGARAWLMTALTQGRPVLCVVDRGEHWVAAIGTLGNQILLVADSADNELVRGVPVELFLNRWGDERYRTAYDGIVI